MSHYVRLTEKLIHCFRMTRKYYMEDNNCLWSIWHDNAEAYCHDYEKHLSKREIGDAVMTAQQFVNAHPWMQNHAPMAELADAPDLGSGVVRRGCSNHPGCATTFDMKWLCSSGGRASA